MLYGKCMNSQCHSREAADGGVWGMVKPFSPFFNHQIQV